MGFLLVGFNYEWLWTIKFMEIPHVQLVKSRTENWVGHNSLVSIIDKLKYPKTLWIVIVFIKYIQFDSISPYLGVQITLFTPPTASNDKDSPPDFGASPHNLPSALHAADYATPHFCWSTADSPHWSYPPSPWCRSDQRQQCRLGETLAHGSGLGLR